MNRGCLMEEELADYLERRLPPGRRSRLEEHLSKCESCLQEFLLLRELFQAKEAEHPEPVPASVTEGAIDFLKRRQAFPSPSIWVRFKRPLLDLKAGLLERLQPLTWRAQDLLLPVRGNDKVSKGGVVHIRKSFDGIDAAIHIWKTGKERATISVSLIRKNGEGGIRATLKRGSREISSHPLLGTEPILFEDIPYGPCRLAFSRNGVRLGEYPLVLREIHHGRK